MEKSELRKIYLSRRAGLCDQEREQYSRAIIERLLENKDFRSAGSVFCYHSLPGEADTRELIERILDGNKALYLPVVLKKRMFAVRYRKGDKLIKSFMNIYQPEFSPQSTIENPDVTIVPLVAFDERLYRLGYGGGYYDRFLSASKTKKIGIAFEIQKTDKLEIQPFDIRLDLIITEKGEYHGRDKE